MPDPLTADGLARFSATAAAHGPAHPGAEGTRRPRPGFLHRRQLGLLHLGGHRRAGPFGWAGGLGSTWLVDPGRDLTVIVATQRMFDDSGPPPVHEALQAVAYGALA
ncbi:MAG TPA: hypothetical protein VF933_37175 [Streptosporangiaceae bacterium]